MPEATEYTELTIYGIGRSQRECHGHGDFSDETAIRKILTEMANNVWNEDFPPFFLTEREALEFIGLSRHYDILVPVKLKLMLPVDVYQCMYNLLVRLEGIEPTCSQARPLPFG